MKYLIILPVILNIFCIQVQAQTVPYIELNLGESTFHSIEWSPTGDYLAVSENHGVSIYTPALELIATLPERHIDVITGLSWKMDGEYLATAAMDGNIHIWNVVNLPSVTLEQTLVHDKPIWGIRWGSDFQLSSVVSEGFIISSDGATGRSTINIWNAKTSLLTYISDIQYHGSPNAEWSHDGELLAYPSYSFENDYHIQLWDMMPNAQQLEIIFGAGGEIYTQTR